jgi:L-threonylcarbamoyladenylate synthase
MSTRKYDTGEAGIEAAAEEVRQGGVIVYPTETCYGIGGDAINKSVINTVYELKQRPRKKGLTAIVADLAMAERYCRLTAHERHLCEELMPGPLTLVAKKQSVVPQELNTQFVFRIPGDETARKIASRANTPIIATSANISGEPSNYTVDGIDESIIHNVAVVLDRGKLEERAPSTIVELTEHAVKVHRDGPVSKEQIHRVLND